MEREAILLYLKNILDLEAAKQLLRNIYGQEERQVRQILNNLEKYSNLAFVSEEYDPGEEPEVTVDISIIHAIAMGMCLLFGVLFTPGIFYKDFSETPEEAFSITFFGIVLLIIGGVLLHNAIGKWKKSKAINKRWKKKATNEYIAKKNEEAKQTNREIARKKQMSKTSIEKIKRQWSEKSSYYNREWQKVNNVLRDLYNMNLIPIQLRPEEYRGGLSAIIWIYRWMSTGRSSLEDAIKSAQFEDGVRRIEDKIDAVLYEVQNNMRQTRLLDEKLQYQIEQNNTMIETLERTESNSSVAAQYAQLSACYNKANAYFALANYLKDTKK